MRTVRWSSDDALKSQLWIASNAQLKQLRFNTENWKYPRTRRTWGTSFCENEGGVLSTLLTSREEWTIQNWLPLALHMSHSNKNHAYAASKKAKSGEGHHDLQRQRRVLRTMFLIFAFAQLRADDLKNDPQMCQKTPQMNEVVNTNHQIYKSLWRRVFNLSTFLESL